MTNDNQTRRFLAGTDIPVLPRKSAPPPVIDATIRNTPEGPAVTVNTETFGKLADARARGHAAFGQIALALAALPRYASLTFADIVPYVLEPLVRNRIVLARPRAADGREELNATPGIAIWASVSPEAEAKIKAQIAAGVFPVRLAPDDWTSGKIAWLLDVIAPDSKFAVGVIHCYRHMTKQGYFHVHPKIRDLIDAEEFARLGGMMMNVAAANVNS